MLISSALRRISRPAVGVVPFSLSAATIDAQQGATERTRIILKIFRFVSCNGSTANAVWRRSILETDARAHEFNLLCNFFQWLKVFAEKIIEFALHSNQFNSTNFRDAVIATSRYCSTFCPWIILKDRNFFNYFYRNPLNTQQFIAQLQLRCSKQCLLYIDCSLA